MRMPRFLSRPFATVLTVLLGTTLGLAGCGSDSTGGTAASTSRGSTGPSRVSVHRTADFDAVGVIGHSGATGANSTGEDTDVRGNSWATGDNPAVDSVYLRLLSDHPALEGHNFNAAEDGPASTALLEQAKQLLAMDPVPDLVLINS